MRKEARITSLTGLFFLMNDFCQESEPALEKRLLEQRQRKRRRQAEQCRDKQHKYQFLRMVS